MENDYYSIESILAENQKIQCTFKVDIPDMGHLDGGKTGDIKALSKVQIPLWMAYILIYSDHADFIVPTPFSMRVLNALDAEPRSVRLSALVGQGGLWYGFGRTIIHLLNDESAKKLSEALTKTFQARLPEVVDQAQHFASLHTSAGASGGDAGTAAFREGLDGTERELFQLAQESAKKTKAWYETSEKGKR
ncbi:GINS complex Psf3 component [Trametes meyenii]|nr:GINS complex Psf3 component [Trametes meyenii]